jgi:hypothetical protein
MEMSQASQMSVGVSQASGAGAACNGGSSCQVLTGQLVCEVAAADAQARQHHDGVTDSVSSELVVALPGCAPCLHSKCRACCIVFAACQHESHLCGCAKDMGVDRVAGVDVVVLPTPVHACSGIRCFAVAIRAPWKWCLWARHLVVKASCDDDGCNRWLQW